MVHMNHTYKSDILKVTAQYLEEAPARKFYVGGGTWSIDIREMLLENLKSYRFLESNS